MRKYYSEPELEIIKYGISAEVIFTDSVPGIDDGDEFDLDAAGDVFAD